MGLCLLCQSLGQACMTPACRRHAGTKQSSASSKTPVRCAPVDGPRVWTLSRPLRCASTSATPQRHRPATSPATSTAFATMETRSRRRSSGGALSSRNPNAQSSSGLPVRAGGCGVALARRAIIVRLHLSFAGARKIALKSSRTAQGCLHSSTLDCGRSHFKFSPRSVL